ncbi:MAG: glycosyltransferase family 4 protein [Dehalococcoidia bacterium]
MHIVEINDIASVASDLSRALEHRGHRVTVIRPRLIGGGLPWTIKPVVGPFRALEWADIIQRLRREKPDILHIHYAYLGMIGVLGRFPYILHCHGSDVREITPFTRPLVERALAGALRVYYATPDLAPYVTSRRPDAEFLPNPVDSEAFAPTTPATEASGVYICCSLTDIKGWRRLYRACAQLAKVRPDIQVTALDYGDHVQAFAKLPNVRLLPFQRRDQLPALINQHAIVVGQAFLGALGMAELEAMACARPVVAWYRNNAGYVEPPPIWRAVDGIDIARAVIRLHDDPAARETLGDAARGWVVRNHGMDHTAARVEAAGVDALETYRAARAAS